jgi:hypothetical protein
MFAVIRRDEARGGQDHSRTITPFLLRILPMLSLTLSQYGSALPA